MRLATGVLSLLRATLPKLDAVTRRRRCRYQSGESDYCWVADGLGLLSSHQYLPPVELQAQTIKLLRQNIWLLGRWPIVMLQRSRRNILRLAPVFWWFLLLLLRHITNSIVHTCYEHQQTEVSSFVVQILQPHHSLHCNCVCGTVWTTLHLLLR